MNKLMDKKIDLVENFSSGDDFSIFSSIYVIIHFIAFVFAIYLSFKCNCGFSFWGFLVACCCPWCYILYALAVHGTGLCKDFTKGKHGCSKSHK